jgi:hypothetical protein
MKQTAVEQFIEQLEKQGDSWENVSMGTIKISIKVEDYLQLKKQAKEMEKQQIIDAYKQGQFDGDIIRDTDAEQYYNQTFREIEKL